MAKGPCEVHLTKGGNGVNAQNESVASAYRRGALGRVYDTAIPPVVKSGSMGEVTVAHHCRSRSGIADWAEHNYDDPMVFSVRLLRLAGKPPPVAHAGVDLLIFYGTSHNSGAYVQDVYVYVKDPKLFGDRTDWELIAYGNGILDDAPEFIACVCVDEGAHLVLFKGADGRIVTQMHIPKAFARVRVLSGLRG